MQQHIAVLTGGTCFTLRCALASIAGLMFTTEALVSEVPGKAAQAAGMFAGMGDGY